MTVVVDKVGQGHHSSPQPPYDSPAGHELYYVSIQIAILAGSALVNKVYYEREKGGRRLKIPNIVVAPYNPLITLPGTGTTT